MKIEDALCVPNMGDIYYVWSQIIYYLFTNAGLFTQHLLFSSSISIIIYSYNID